MDILENCLLEERTHKPPTVMCVQGRNGPSLSDLPLWCALLAYM